MPPMLMPPYFQNERHLSWPHYYHHDIHHHQTPLMTHHRLGQMPQNSTMTTTPLVSTAINSSVLVTTTTSTSQPQSCFSKNCFKPIVVSSHPTNPPNDLRVKDISETDLILEATVSNTTSSDCEENSPGGSNNQNNIVKESNLFDVLKVLRESKRKKNTGLDEKYKRFSMNNIEDIKSSALNIFHFSPITANKGNKVTEPEG